MIVSSSIEEGSGTFQCNRIGSPTGSSHFKLMPRLSDSMSLAKGEQKQHLCDPVEGPFVNSHG